MKLKFSIRYRTAWGEGMHVAITYHRQDGTERHQNLPLLTEDGELWTLETAALTSRQHPLSHIIYNYQVENAEGDVLRSEWNEIPRLYHFDATQDYIFQDQWRDLSLQHYLFRWTKRPLAYLKNIPFFDRSIVFRVSAPHIKSSQHVALLGSEGPLGAWNV